MRFYSEEGVATNRDQGKLQLPASGGTVNAALADHQLLPALRDSSASQRSSNASSSTSIAARREASCRASAGFPHAARQVRLLGLQISNLTGQRL